MNQTLSSQTLAALTEAGVRRDKILYEQVYFYPPMMSFLPYTAQRLEELSGSGASRETSLYIHIPFCTGHCTYCHYSTYVGQEADGTNAYLDLLEREFELLMEHRCFERRNWQIFHVGGGTPTYLEPDQIKRLLDLIQELKPLESGAEFTWESSPETIVGAKADKLSLLLSSGVNRLSIGIESFEDHILKTCGRRYRTDTAVRAYLEARERGFQNINLDMIYGLADQTLDDWKRTLEVVMELKPDCLTTYHLRMKPGTPMASFSISRFPSEDVCRDMQITTITELTNAGYTQVLGNQFVLDRSKSYRYEVEKWKDNRDIIGIGASAYSYIDGWAYYNIRSLPEYTAAVSNGQLPINLERRLSPAQRAARMVVLGLRVVPDGVSKLLFVELFDSTLEESFGKELTRLEDLGLIENSPERICLTPLGILFSDEVCIEFYAEEDKEQLKRAGASKYGLYLDCPDHLAKKAKAARAI